jgi:acid phosphatase
MDLFLTFVSLASCVLDARCKADLKTPEPIPGKSLKFLQLLVRHGARTPLTPLLPALSRGYWLCDSSEAIAPRIHAAPVEHYRRFKQVLDQRVTDFPPNCREGDLLVSGMEQHRNLGKFIYDYMRAQKLIAEDLPLNPSHLNVRCSPVERTLRSAQSFLHGCFPPQSPNEVIDIVTDTHEHSLLRLDYKHYRDAKNVYEKWVQSKAYEKWLNVTWDGISAFAKELGYGTKNETAVNDVCDWIGAYYCSDKRLPVNATKSVIEACQKSYADWGWELFESNYTVMGAPIMRELVRVPKEVVNGSSSVKFSLESSHDSAVSAIMVFLHDRLNMTWVPPYASYLGLELWKGDKDAKYTVRWTFNGNEIPLREMKNETRVEWDAFLEAYSDMNKYCLDWEAQI